MPAATLSDYQCECANPNAAKTPQTYKQGGPVVRLDRDVREVQKWAGIEDPKGASMTRDTRTALRDKIAEYQKQNGLDVKTPGELNQATLDRMRQDKTLPEGLADSLQKVKPYYKPEALPRITCVAKPGEAVPEAGANKTAPVEPRSLDSYKLSDGKGMDVDQRELPRIQAEALQNITRDFQRRQGMGQSGLMDQGTIDRMKSTPGYEAFGRQIESWKKDGLVDGQGRWDQKRDADIRAQVAAAQKPQVPKAAEPSGITNIDPAEWRKKWQAGAAEAEIAGQGKPGTNPFAGKTLQGGESTFIKGPALLSDPAPITIQGPARLSEPMGLMMPVQWGQRFDFENATIQPTFVTASAHSGSQSLEVMARTPKQDGPAADADATARMTQRNQFTPN